jgi:16S rRNA (uracil1498-N3)-methyltransferase
VQAIPKGDRAELAVSMLTEVGVDRIIPWESEHCVVQWRGDRADKGVAKWRSAAWEAAKQARRSTIPEVTDRLHTRELITMIEPAIARGSVVWVLDETAQGIAPLTPNTESVWLIVGPEGGLSGNERTAFADAGAMSMRCGQSVLRTSTAGVVGASVVSTLTRWQ